ncbi:major intrinsic protein [Xylanimonas cellulosilytica DSM 15894]|uniref:Major intrinsic protein n=1 Tax=Xylanimonas cellulosilytica (strain DSM 15894 / JCM 12276 / CECT 5975 / KCTC 9989 / LMG 20990 / NBRC 107835 / XIL07) TaxID=446471 RepID=D1BY67_XYLCX|nr:MIP/aquaporin family protein [Xylanimonas cellulosilytica]ACZ29910.1 major intrinsic protein [Xylanimonas cellulosilytica DSM 15894]
MLLDAFWSEVLGTGVLLLLGIAVNANITLPRTKGHGNDWLLTSLGWGLAVFTAVFVAFRSGAHLNPAVTLGMLVVGDPFVTTDAGTIAPSVAAAGVYVAGQLVGAFAGAVLAWVAFKKHFDLGAEPGAMLGIFATGPAVRSYPWNLVTEAIGTFVLVTWVLLQDQTPAEIGPLAVALVVVAIGAGLGGPTGYAINPARDLGPRIAHAVLPLPGKRGSDWRYAWVPVVGPCTGAVLAGLLVLAWR